MSATPPWFYIVDSYRESSMDDPLLTRVQCDDYDRLLHALEAFDALLAVAKAAERIDEHSSISHMSKELDDALMALTAAHHDWREWTA